MSDIKLEKCPLCGADCATFMTAKEAEECKHFEDEYCPCFHTVVDRICTVYGVVCDFTKGGCGASTGWRKTKEDAAKSWNTRVDSNAVEEISEGKSFNYRGIEYVCLEIFDKEVYGSRAALCVTSQIAETMSFSDKCNDGSNNFAVSKVRKYLNDVYLPEHLDVDNLIPFKSDLTADNGDDSYGTCEDYVFLLSCAQYRRYRKHMPKYDDWVWTLTPWSCNTGSARGVRYVYPSGNLSGSIATHSYGVAPACLFNLDNLINQHRQVRYVGDTDE